MMQSKTTELLRNLGSDPVNRTAQCPDDHDLAAFATGLLADEHRERLQRHVADCGYCLRQVGLLSHLADSEPLAGVSEFTMARARRLGKPRLDQGLRRTTHWAAAALVVLAVAAGVSQYASAPRGSASGNVSPAVSAYQEQASGQVRNSGQSLSAPKVLAPAKGAQVDPGNLTIQWTDVTGSLYYDVRIVSAEGDLIWEQQVSDDQLTLPPGMPFTPGTEYFVRVDAYLADARSISSHHVPFTIHKRD